MEDDGLGRREEVEVELGRMAIQENSPRGTWLLPLVDEMSEIEEGAGKQAHA